MEQTSSMHGSSQAREALGPQGASQQRWAPREQLLHFIRARDVPCPLCGYNLRALSEPRCPECGKEFVLTVRPVVPLMRAWVVLTAAACASSGVGVLLAFICLWQGMPPRAHGLVPPLPIAYFLAAIPLTFYVLISRRRLLQRSPRFQWALAAGAVILSVVAFLVVCSWL